MNLLLLIKDIKNDSYLLSILNKQSINEATTKDKYNNDSEEE
jgi:hypothetical protein